MNELKSPSRPSRCARRGVAAVAMVIVLLILQLVIVAMVLGSGRDQQLTIHGLDAVHAFYAAEAGMNMGIREMKSCGDGDGDGTVGSISEDTPVNDANDPNIGPAQVIVTYSTDCDTITLKSTGRHGSARHAIQVDLD